MSRTPEVLPGLRLPDQQGVWVLDMYQNRPELVELTQNSGNVNRRTGHNVLRGALDQMRHPKQPIEMNGAVSKVQLHIDAPVFYVSLSTNGQEESGPAPSALTVDTHGASSAVDKDAKDAYSSPTSQYQIVRVENNFKRNYRVVSTGKGVNGNPAGNDNIVPTKAEILPGKHWMKLTPQGPLTIGDYALMEILSPGEANLSVWDFRVDPQQPENANAILPLDRNSPGRNP